MVLGFLIISNSNDLFIVFLGFETQSFSFIVLLSSSKKEFENVEGGLKYFIVGVLSSIFFLVGYLLLWADNPYSSSFLSFDKKNTGWIFILMSVLTKLGSAPLHFWVVDVLESSTWPLFLIFSIIPKISLIFFLLKTLSWTEIFDVIALASLIFGLVGALNQTKIKRLIAYSNVANLGLILLLIKIGNLHNIQPLILFLTVYFINLIVIILLLKWTQLSNNPFIINLNKSLNNLLPMFTLGMVFLSVGGVPPLSGFIAKWVLITNLISNHYYFQSVVIIFLSILTIIYYLSISYTLFLKKIPNFNKWESIIINQDPIPYEKLIFTAFLTFLTLTSAFMVGFYGNLLILFL